MSNYDWPVSMLEGCNVPGETMTFFQSIWDESGETSKKLDDLYNEHEILKGTCAKQERYIEELEKQLCILQKTLELVDKNKPRFIVKPSKVSQEELIDLQNGPVIFNTEDEHIVPICQDQWISVKDRLPEVYLQVLVCDVRENYIGVWEYMGNEIWCGEEITWSTEDITHWMPLPEPPKGE